MEPVTLRLKRLREAASPAVTIRGMAEALGMAHSTYAAYEDPKKFKKPILPLDLAKKIGSVLGGRGIDENKVMELAGLSGRLGSGVAEKKELLRVEGAVAAGIWREQSSWPEDERYYIEVGPNPFPGSERFAVRMEGYSMDRTIPPGSELQCIRVAYGYVEPRPGQLVIVERTNHDLTEMTCKRLSQSDDEWVLLCESTKPEFQEPIVLGRPNADLYIDDEIRIIGLVHKAEQSHLDLTGYR